MPITMTATTGTVTQTIETDMNGTIGIAGMIGETGIVGIIPTNLEIIATTALLSGTAARSFIVPANEMVTE